MTIALTGGTGLVGGAILEKLLEQGYHVRALDRYGKLDAQRNLEIIRGDLTAPADLEKLCQGCDVIIHCAALVKASHAEIYQKVNAHATGALGETAVKKGISRFLYISSLAARCPDISPYAASKAEGESRLQNAAGSGMTWDVLRPPAVYGPEDRQILTFFKLLRFKIGLIPNVENPRISLIHIEDLASAVYAWVEAKQATNQIYEINGAGNSSYSWREILQTASRAMELTPIIVPVPKWLMMAYAYPVFWAGGVRKRIPVLTPDKIRELYYPHWHVKEERFEEKFGWAPKVNLESGFDQTILWYYQHEWL